MVMCVGGEVICQCWVRHMHVMGVDMCAVLSSLEVQWRDYLGVHFPFSKIIEGVGLHGHVASQ